jgi:hypothetical protein
VRGAAPYRITTVAPRGWRPGHLIAQAASGQVGDHPGDFVLVVDDRSGAVTNVLELAASGVKGCCAVLGWPGSDTVIVRTDTDVLLWQLTTGAVTQPTDNAPGSLSLGPSGCASKITIEGVTTSCMP